MYTNEQPVSRKAVIDLAYEPQGLIPQRRFREGPALAGIGRCQALRVHRTKQQDVAQRRTAGDQNLPTPGLHGALVDELHMPGPDEMLADDMSHGVKNLFPIASAPTTHAARSAASTTYMGPDLPQ